jgi:hybrid cluster-associated redox disulfide protein|tara:strand:- start:302 stop:535 length:234 start_codon:yes stop_codon:yes gene_type:complete
MLIKKESKINEIIQSYPHTIDLFRGLNMSCSGCFAVHFDTLENGALMHGMDVNSLIDKVQKSIIGNTPSVDPLIPKA